MEKSLVIDFKLLKELSITVNQFLFLVNLYYDDIIFKIITTEKEETDLQDKKFIKIHYSICELRQTSLDLIDTLLVTSDKELQDNKSPSKKSDRIIEDEVNNNIKEFRELWRGLKPGSMGSLQSCKDKMKRWIKANPEYSFNEIMKAAKLYLATEGRNVRFLQRADYFIYKQSNNREEESRLSAYIDDTMEDDDWTTKLQ